MKKPDGMSCVDIAGGANYVLISQKDVSPASSVKRASLPLLIYTPYEKYRFPIDIKIHKPVFNAHYGYFCEICNAKKVLTSMG